MLSPFRLGPWTVEPSLHRLSRSDGEARQVSHKVMAVLCCLAERAGEVVSKDALVEQVWDGAFTSDESLTTVIYALRKALDDAARRPRFIETIRKGGYRLVAEVEPLVDDDGDRDRDRVHDLDQGGGGGVVVPPLTAKKIPPDPPLLKGGKRMSLQTGRRRWVGLLVAGGALALVAVGLPLASIVRAPSEPSTEPGLQPSFGEQGDTPTQSEATLESLAVLPLTSFGETCGEDAFAGGLTEMLVVDLAQAVPLEVLPSLATRGLNASWNLDQVLAEVDADLVVEGSVVRSAERLWLSVQLVDTASGRMLWGGSFERQIVDPLLVQRDLAAIISNEIQRTVLEAASTAAAADGPHHPITPSPTLR